MSQRTPKHPRYLLLLAPSLGVVQAAYIAHMSRSAVLDVLYMNYTRTARVKGLKESVVILIYGPKNTGPAILTVVG